MATRVTIDELPEATAVPSGSYLVIQDAGTSKKISASLLDDEPTAVAHIANTVNAHAATAISATAGAVFTGPNVQSQLGQAESAITSHLVDTVAAHAASAIAFAPTGTISATDVQAAILEVAAEAGAGGGGTGTITSINGDAGPVVNLVASEIPFTPVSGIDATTVQAAVAEVNVDKVAGLNGATGLWIGTLAQYNAITPISTVVYIVTG